MIECVECTDHEFVYWSMGAVYHTCKRCGYSSRQIARLGRALGVDVIVVVLYSSNRGAVRCHGGKIGLPGIEDFLDMSRDEMMFLGAEWTLEKIRNWAPYQALGQAAEEWER